MHQNGSDITSTLLTKTKTKYMAPALNVNPSTTYNFTLVEVLPPVHIIESNGTVITSARFQGGINLLEFTADATGVHYIKIYITSPPWRVYVDRVAYSNWTYSNGVLTITYDFGSTHTFQVYQYNPGGGGGIVTPPPLEEAPTAAPPAAAPKYTGAPLVILAALVILALLVIVLRKKR